MKISSFIILVSLLACTSGQGSPKVNLKGNNKVYKHEHLDLSKKFVLVLDGTVTDSNMQQLADKLEDVPNDGRVHLVINSYGGSVDAGLIFINKVEAYKAQGKMKFLHCYIQDNAMSMAQIISSYCDGVLIHKFGSFMMHEASYGMRGSQSEMRGRVKWVEGFLAQIWQDVASNYGLSMKQLNDFMDKERFMTATEAVKYGFADGLYDTLYHEGFVPEVKEFNLFGF